MQHNLTPDTSKRLEFIKQHSDQYKPNQNVIDCLRQKSLVMLVGPCATGKSYLINKIVNQNEDFRKSLSFTSRLPRPDDTPDTVRHIRWDDWSINQFYSDIERGNFVNFIFHPKTSEIYGSDISGHPGRYNLMPTLSGSVESLVNLPFAKTYTIGVVTGISLWQSWFNSRSFNKMEQSSRINEALTHYNGYWITPMYQ